MIKGYIKWKQGMEVITLYSYRTKDGYRGSILQVKKKDENKNKT